MTITRNEILDEIHAAREAWLAKHGGDVHAYVEAARKRALESGLALAIPKQRTNDSAEAAEAADCAIGDGESSLAAR